LFRRSQFTVLKREWEWEWERERERDNNTINWQKSTIILCAMNRTLFMSFKRNVSDVQHEEAQGRYSDLLQSLAVHSIRRPWSNTVDMKSKREENVHWIVRQHRDELQYDIDCAHPATVSSQITIETLQQFITRKNVKSEEREFQIFKEQRETDKRWIIN
jgi:hypothetical protein